MRLLRNLAATIFLLAFYFCGDRGIRVKAMCFDCGCEDVYFEEFGADTDDPNVAVNACFNNLTLYCNDECQDADQYRLCVMDDQRSSCGSAVDLRESLGVYISYGTCWCTRGALPPI